MSFFGKNSHVVELTDRSFKRRTLVNVTKPTLVMFYAPWCPYCTMLKPVFVKLAKLAAQDGSFSVAALDATRYDAVAQDLEINGFPTLRLFLTDGRSIEYPSDGERTAEQMHDFVKRHLGYFDNDPYVEEFTDKDIKKIATPNKNKEPCLVMFYAPWCPYCKRLQDVWRSLGHSLGGIAKVGAYNCDANRKLAQKLDVSSFPTIVLYSGGVPHLHTGNDRSVQGLMKFACSVLKEGACRSI